MHANLHNNIKRQIPLTHSSRFPQSHLKNLKQFGTQLFLKRLLRKDFEYVRQARNPTVVSPTPFDGLTMNFGTYLPLRAYVLN